MKIRYHQQGSNVHRTTKDFNPEGTPTGKFRLGIIRDGKVLTGDRLKAELLKSLYPDIPFPVALPIVEKPRSHYEWQWIEEMQPDGFIIKKKVYELVHDVSVEEYELALSLYEDKLREYLVWAHELALPNIPDGDGWIWEEVDMTKPYRFRYTEIPVEVGKYKGNVWVLSEADLFREFAETCATLTNRLYSLTNKVFS